MRIAQINGGVFGSTGSIMFGISDLAEQNGMEVRCFSPITISNRYQEPNHVYTKIGNYRGRQVSVLAARLTGLNGCFAWIETMKLLKQLDEFQPNVIQLHNLHDSYVNLPMLFSYIKKREIAVVWTLHDCWAMTGHCTHFTVAECDRWKTGCFACAQVHSYPKSILDNSSIMWRMKRTWFTGIKDMQIVTPSKWLANLVDQSFLRIYPIHVINNGIDISVFRPTENKRKQLFDTEGKKLVLGVSFGWNEKKGLNDFLKLAKIIDDEFLIVLVGVNENLEKSFPDNIIGISRTESQKQLVDIYSSVDVFVNLTYEDTYPTVNLEARACGLPVITYDSCGSPESAGEDGVVVEKGNIHGVRSAIVELVKKERKRSLSANSISSNSRFLEYVDLYRQYNKGNAEF